MEPSTTLFKDNEKPSAAYPTQGIGYPPEVYPPPPHYGGGYAPAPPPPMPGYGGYPSPPPPYAAFPPPCNTGPYTPPPPQAYGYPHHPPPPAAYGYAPPAASAPTKKKKKSGMSKILGMGAGLVGGVVGGLLLGELAADGGAAPPSFDMFSNPTGGGGMDYGASMQSMSNSMDTMGSIG